MPKSYIKWLHAVLLFLSSISIQAQTTLYPGDIIVFAWGSDMAMCGVTPMADELSFMCFQDITAGTEIDLTDNGWEHQYPGFWGDSEGTIRMTRTGGTIPRGTVITLQGRIIAGNWVYRTISPDNGWSFTNLNIPGGAFNIDPGGDQVFFMQGGTWDNQGGGANRAKYDGRLIYGANSLGYWAANGTVNTSNLPLDPCYSMEMSTGLSNAAYIRFAGDISPGDHFEWLERVKYWPDWNTFGDCIDYNSYANNYLGQTFTITDEFSIGCWVCDGCNPHEDALILNLPWDGEYNVTYTNGVDTFEALGVSGINGVGVTVTEDVTFSLVSVEKVGGCTVYSHFSGPVTLTAPYRDPGTHGELFVCPNVGVYALFYFLGGTPEPGGVWYPPLMPDFWGNLMYLSNWGPGTYVYTQEYQPPHTCPPDTASVTVYWTNIDDTDVEVSCDVNGTPNDITDDRIVVTLNVKGEGFGPDYTIDAFSGDISPTTGVAGIPQTFYLDPGTATLTYMTLHLTSLNPLWCDFYIDITPPGFCSDPCDYDMLTTISGPDDLCAQNCVVEPATMLIDISGGTPPYKMDFTLSAPSYSPWVHSFTGIVPSGEISICVDTVPAPVYNALTGQLIIPQFLAGSEITFTLDQMYDFYGCGGSLGNAEHTFYIHPQPTVTTTALMLCLDEAKNIDLTEYDALINPFYDVTWYDGDPLQGGEEINSPTGANLVNVVQLWALVTDDYCKNSIQVPFTIFPVPDLDSVPPVRICQGDAIALSAIPLHDAGNSGATYTYHASLPPDSTNILDPLYYVPVDSTTIYVLATAAICYDTLPIQIFVEDYPDFTLEGQPCDLLQGTYSVLFTSSADSIHASAGVVVNNASGQDAVTGIPNNTNVTIEILNPTGLCNDTILIVAPNCNCPMINQPVPGAAGYSLCEDETSPVMSVTVDPGMVANWYTVPSGGVAFLQNSLTYQPVTPVNATYYVEALDPASNCYSIRTSIGLQVYPLPVLQSPADPVLCAGETLDLNALTPVVLNGVPGSGGWFKLPGNLPASGTVVPQNGDTWQYIFTSAAGNCEDRDTVTAIVHPLPAVLVYDILCDDQALTYELLFTSNADVVQVSGGTLVQIAGTDSFALQDIPFDTDIQFDLEITATGCTSSILLPAPDCSCPALLASSVYQLCSDPGTVDLSTFEGPGVNGTWQMVSTPPGANPATLSGSNFDGFQADPGLYTLRFIRSVILSNCVDSALFQLTLRGSPYADAGSNGMVCAPDNIILTGTAGGTNTVHNWQTSGSGVISNPGALNLTYTPTLADITAGSVNFTLTSTDQGGVCPAATETVTITIDGRAYYILNAGTQTYCDTTNTLVDLDALITFGNTGGTWFFPDTVNAPVTGSSQINPSTLTAGSYTIFYTTNNAVAPCKNDTTGVNLLIRNCACPSVAVSSPLQGLCSESGSLNLNTLLLTSEPGTWSIVSAPAGTKPAVINGAQFVTSNSDAGTYRIRYSLTNAVAGCPDFSEVNLNVIAIPTISVAEVKCAGDLQTWQATVTSSGIPTTSEGNIVPLGGNQYRIENITLNTSLQVSVSSGNGLCTATLNIPSADCACTLSISNLPVSVDLCPDESITLQAQVNDPKGSVTAFWIVGNDSLYQNTLQVTQAGSYEFVAEDALGCKENQIVNVAYYQEMIPGVSWVDITCPGDHDGVIAIQGIMGGNGPFYVAVNGGAQEQITVFPYIIDGLGAGTYHLELVDGTNCKTEVDVEIKSASSESLNLGPDQVILAGDSVVIKPLLSFTPDTFYWSGDDGHLLQADQLNQVIRPETDQLFQLTGIDSKGCEYSDELKIRVLLNSNVYVPNVFSPNGDGVNDVLFPLTDPSITYIQYFEIYSRWGELVYSVKDITPGQTSVGWDGTLNNERMMPGVYVYRIALTNKRGKEFFFSGDVTLVR